MIKLVTFKVKACSGGYVTHGNSRPGIREALEQFAAIEPLTESSVLLKQDTKVRAGMVELAGHEYFCKAYLDHDYKDRLKSMLTQSRAKRAFAITQALFAANLPVPEPIGYVEITQGDRKGTGYLLLEALHNVVDLRRCIDRDDLNDWLDSHKILEKAGHLLAGFHNAGFVHGDFKWGNVLYHNSTGLLYATDFDGTKIVAAPRKKNISAAQVKDIARFMINGEQAKVDSTRLNAFVASYCAHAQQEQAQLLEAVLPKMNAFRSRHLKKYGENRYG